MKPSEIGPPLNRPASSVAKLMAEWLYATITGGARGRDRILVAENLDRLHQGPVPLIGLSGGMSMPRARHCRHCWGDCAGDCLLPG
jgi:hypothetical protein